MKGILRLVQSDRGCAGHVWSHQALHCWSREVKDSWIDDLKERWHDIVSSNLVLSWVNPLTYLTLKCPQIQLLLNVEIISKDGTISGIEIYTVPYVILFMHCKHSTNTIHTEEKGGIKITCYFKVKFWTFLTCLLNYFKFNIFWFWLWFKTQHINTL
jgi:hypothetical protein